MIEVAVKRSENAGKLLHKNIVREMILLGHWRGEAAKFPLPAAEDAELAERRLSRPRALGL